MLRQVTQGFGGTGSFAAAQNQTIEILLDDTSILLAPGSTATVSSDAETGVIAIRLTAGLIRVAGARSTQRPRS